MELVFHDQILRNAVTRESFCEERLKVLCGKEKARGGFIVLGKGEISGNIRAKMLNYNDLD